MTLMVKDLLALLKHWRLLLLYCALIYIGLPAGPDIWKALGRLLGPSAKGLPVLILCLVFAATILRFLLLKKKYKIQGFLIIIFAFLIFLKIAANIDSPSEKIHLVEYALLAFVIYSRINKNQPASALHFKILIIGFIVGAVDELLQKFIPGRVCDFRDVLLNTASVSLAQMVIYSLEHLC